MKSGMLVTMTLASTPAPNSLFSLLCEAAKNRGDAPLYRFLVKGEVDGPQEMLSARALEADARKIGAALRDRLPGSKDGPPRVLVACSSPIDFARAFFACLCAGAVPVPVNPPLRSTEAGLSGLRSVMKDARPSSVIADASTVTAIQSAGQELDHCPILTVGELSETGLGSEFEIKASPDDTAFLQYTSGSTSSPRGVMITHANILSNLQSIACASCAPPDAVGVSWLPLAHDMGLIGNLLLSLHTGFELVLMTPLAFVERPVRWLKAISKFRAWGTSAPNFAFVLCDRVIRKPELEDVDLSCLEAVFCGAEPIDAAALDRFSHRFQPQGFRRGCIRPCYGLAEATLFVSMAARESLAVKLFDPAELAGGQLQELAGSNAGRAIVSCGPVQPDLNLAIVDPFTSQRLDNGEIGEIWLSGTPVAKAYFGRSNEQNDETFRAILRGAPGRFLRTGDLGALHEGELYITGRTKELIIVHGRNYDAHDLERIVVTAHPDLSVGHVVVFADFDRGERVVVLVELPASAAESEYGKIVRRIRARLGQAAGLRPESVVIAAPKSIPITSSGKLRRVEAHRRYKLGSIVPLLIDERPAGGDENTADLGKLPVPWDDDISFQAIEKVLIREIKTAARLGQREQLQPQARLSELGVDSLGLIQIATAMRDFLQRDVPSSIIDDDPPLSILLDRLRISDNTLAGPEEQPASADTRHLLRESVFDDVFEPAVRFNQIVRKSDLSSFYRAFSNWEGTHARLGGQRILILSAFDYLGLGSHPRVRASAAEAAEQSGTSRSGSRVHSGTTPEILALEEKLARFVHRESALICTTGYNAMAAVVTAFMNSRTTLVVDEAIHASILDGAAISRCRLLRFRHNDSHELDAILAETKSAMVMVEGLYSNHGDLSPLSEIREICTRHKARLALDDAHGLGSLGSTGRGAEEHYGLLGASDILAGTFSKSLASIGGWISGDRDVIEYIRYHGRSLLFTAAIAPPMVAAASTALDILIEQPELVERLARNADAMRWDLRKCSVPVTGLRGPILRVPVHDEAQCIRLSNELLRRGIYVNSVVYPAVPRNEPMIRLCVSAKHDPAELRGAAEEFGDAYRQIIGSALIAG
jgi:7-keto-8-aminopelargonate synthetase-like enzyme/acyl-CoA synthetase (AMP-forming)/AMP-acid ligase II